MPRNNKYWQRRFGNFPHIEPYQHHFDLRRIDELDDEDFAYLLSNVRGVNMLDLNETEITNKSIQLLGNLEYVNELRAKGCDLDDGCAKDLNKVTSLQFLHLKNTRITVHGLLELNALVNLRTLLFSAEDVEKIHQEMLQLKIAHPACEFVIDGKTYYFDSIDRFIYALTQQSCRCRLKIRNQSLNVGWSTGLSQPYKDFIEAKAQGTFSLDEIEWVELDPIEKTTATDGSTMDLDNSAAILALLNQLEFPFIVTDGIISAYLVKKMDA